MKKFLSIAFTPPRLHPDESNAIILLLRSGNIDYFHIRHPEISRDEMEVLIREIPTEFYPRLTLHSHFELCESYNIGGIHLNKRRSEIPPGLPEGVRISRSIHSIEEAEEIKNSEYSMNNKGRGFSYVTLSPVFTSISKEGYESSFDLEDLTFVRKVREINERYCRMIALGGVRPRDFTKIRESGFGGAAILGYIWNLKRPIESVNRDLRDALNKIRK